jgi:hypothetical protein
MTTYTIHDIEIGQFCYTFTSKAEVSHGGSGSYFEPPDPTEIEVERFEFVSAQVVSDGETYDEETYPHDVEKAEKLIWLYCEANPDEWDRIEATILESFDPHENYYE